MCTIIHIHDPLATPWHVNWKLKINNWKLWADDFPCQGVAGGVGSSITWWKSVIYQVFCRANAKGVNANHYIAEIGAYCTWKSRFWALNNKNRMCVFGKRQVRFSKIAHAILKKGTCDFVALHLRKIQYSECEKTVYWMEENSTLKKSKQCTE